MIDMERDKMEKQKYSEITDDVITRLCSFEFGLSERHVKEIKEQIKGYVGEQEAFKVVPAVIGKIEDDIKLGELMLDLGDKSIIGYKHFREGGCGCSSSYVALYDKKEQKIIDEKMFTDYFCVAL